MLPYSLLVDPKTIVSSARGFFLKFRDGGVLPSRNRDDIQLMSGYFNNEVFDGSIETASAVILNINDRIYILPPPQCSAECWEECIPTKYQKDRFMFLGGQTEEIRQTHWFLLVRCISQVVEQTKQRG
jgi:hypothetical protein